MCSDCEVDAVQTRFRREIEAVTAIDHPNIVKILDHGSSPADRTYMVMELVQGPTLRTIIEREAPLDARRVLHFAEQLAAGLSEAHRKGFVHRDLKPANIIVSRDAAGADLLKILDFGIVAAPLEARSERITKTGFLVGTPAYMAPEQVDSKTITPRADVYALGVILSMSC